MNSKILISVLAIITVLIFGYYLYGLAGSKSPKSAPITNQYTNPTPISQNTNSQSFPIDPNTKSVRQVVLVYNFYGKVTNIEQNETSTHFTLDSSDSSTPAFVTGTYTNFYIANGLNAPKPATIKDIKAGSYADFSMLYYPKGKNWELRAVTLQESPVTSASPSPK